MVLYLNPFHPISLTVEILIWIFLYFNISKLHEYAGYAVVRRGDTSSSPKTSITQKRNPRGGLDCECYVTTGPDPGYFQNFFFYDFRKQAVPESRNIKVMPPPVNASAPLGSAYMNKDSLFFDDNFRDHWLFSPFVHPASSEAPLTYVNAVQNAFIYYNETVGPDPVLILRTTRNLDSQSVSGITSRDENIIAATTRSRTRMLSPSKPGSLAGLAMFYSRDGDFSNVTNTYIDTADLSSFAWGVHRLDYLYPYSSLWYNDRPVESLTDFRHPGRRQVSLSIWSDGGLFTGDMGVGDEAYLAAEWFMMAYNNTEDDGLGRSRRPCGKPCKIDDLKVIGVPERCNISDIKVVDIPKSMIRGVDCNRLRRDDKHRIQSGALKDASKYVPKAGERELGIERCGRVTKRDLTHRYQSALKPHNNDEIPDDEASDSEGSAGDGAGEDGAGGGASGGDAFGGVIDGDPSEPTDDGEPPAINPLNSNSPKTPVPTNSGPPLTPPNSHSTIPPHSPPTTPSDARPCCPCACCPRSSRTRPARTPPIPGGGGCIKPQHAYGSWLAVRDWLPPHEPLPTPPEITAARTGCRACSDCTCDAGGVGGAGGGNWLERVKFWVMIGFVAFIMGSVLVVLGCS